MNRLLVSGIFVVAILSTFSYAAPPVTKKQRNRKFDKAVRRALDYLSREQRAQGYWEANSSQYRVAMTSLAGVAFLCEGSTTTQGRYAKNVRRAVTWLIDRADPNSGLIGYKNDYQYIYGHGFAMLFLSQIYGEEEDKERRAELKRVLTKAVEFSRNAQTSKGGWGYVSARDGNDFDEGSTCVTQAQGLRACRNAGIAVPKDTITRAIKYIELCTIKSGPQAGGVVYSYSNRGGGGGARPAITAAAVSTMFSAGEYEGKNVKMMIAYCNKYVWPGSGRANAGHDHYTHLYLAQLQYRLGEKDWRKYINIVGNRILRKQSASGAWTGSYVGPVFGTSIYATILQLDKGYLPIYQR